MPVPTRPAYSLVRVPGKVIISGEHAVVYGTPALACAIQKYAFAKVTDSHFCGVHLRVTAFGIDQYFTRFELSQLAQKTQVRHQQFIAGTGLLSNVVANPAEFFAAAIGASGLLKVLSKSHGLMIELTTSLLVGGGMGSSAALVAAMLGGAFKHLEQPLTLAELVLKTTQSEHWQHGHSSGLDPYVCIMGGLQHYQNGLGELQVLNHLPACFLVTTGQPASSTGDCVEAVKQQKFPPSLWRQFATIEEHLRYSLSGPIAAKITGRGQLEKHVTIINAIASNHQLLQRIGVVPNAIAEFITRIEAQGGAAKICGAGSVTGDHAGLVLVMGIAQTQLHQLCLDQGFGVQAMLPDEQGVVYLD